MNDLQRLRVWLCGLRDKRKLNALAEQIDVDRRTIQRIINREDYHPRFDTFQALKDVMDKDETKRKTRVARAI
ncbi:hypothetical protein CIW54_07595 [Paraburkholderia sp. T12-10]|nr:hypothetical protein CIW54_07595 [Paraburkholderia sp. T12-10]